MSQHNLYEDDQLNTSLLICCLLIDKFKQTWMTAEIDKPRSSDDGLAGSLTYLSLNISGFIGCCPRYDARVAEAGTEQRRHDEDEEEATNHWNGWC